MIQLNDVLAYLRNYDGPQVRIMEVCGTHTASIFKNGIKSLISPKIKLISGPGCPVCVTPSTYIDRACELSLKADHAILTFGDMMKVPGASGSLALAKAAGGNVELIYSPMEALDKAIKNPHITYIIAAVGFETTAPAFALLLEKAIQSNIKNIKLLTALKTIIPAMDWICSTQNAIDGFICPGHVSVIIGEKAYRELEQKYRKPFVIAGFEAEHIIAAIYDILQQIEADKGYVNNLYNNVVRKDGNKKALSIIQKYYHIDDALWRGLGTIQSSGLYLKDEYKAYDAGSKSLIEESEKVCDCLCGNVIIGKIEPDKCSQFGVGCTPANPIGPCMVSGEGACGIWYRNSEKKEVSP